ncbi:hypothetical protein GWL_41930 [Herbaspirillum sp. GW103]|nr:hypothetical protein GWL_41930 [Herbaspirillum sp. GW103]
MLAKRLGSCKKRNSGDESLEFLKATEGPSGTAPRARGAGLLRSASA